MPNERNEPNDPIASWQSQPMETPQMSVEQVRKWADTVGTKNRRELRTRLLAAAFCVVFASQWFWRSSNPVERVLLAVAVLWLIAGQYHTVFAAGSRKLPADAGLSPTIGFLQQELQRKGDEIRLVWLRFLAPFFLIIGTVAVPPLAAAARSSVYLRNIAPFFLLLAAWTIAFYILQNRKRRELRQELQELAALKREGFEG